MVLDIRLKTAEVFAAIGLVVVPLCAWWYGRK
jgi:hypothetical protein